jgi:hypothetical protein
MSEIRTDRSSVAEAVHGRAMSGPLWHARSIPTATLAMHPSIIIAWDAELASDCRTDVLLAWDRTAFLTSGTGVSPRRLPAHGSQSTAPSRRM